MRPASPVSSFGCGRRAEESDRRPARAGASDSAMTTPRSAPRGRLSRRRLLKSMAAVPAGLALGSLLAGPPARTVFAADKPHALKARPNLLLLSVDSLRADHLGAYGYAGGTTPNLDRLAAEGVLVSAAYTAMTSNNPA